MKKLVLAIIATAITAVPIAATAPLASADTVKVSAQRTISETQTQRQARLMARDYLDSSAFSRSGLIEQLKYEGFSTRAAIYGVDHVRVSWYRQALFSAREYLDGQHFSRSGLIDQLKYEGFTWSQAVYGVDHVDVSWYRQAVLVARDYLDGQHFSRSGLIDQLLYEGFTRSQAVYGVNKNGL